MHHLRSVIFKPKWIPSNVILQSEQTDMLNASGTVNFDSEFVPTGYREAKNGVCEFGPTEAGLEGYAFSPLHLKLMGIWATIALVCGTAVNILTIVALSRPANPRIKNPTRSFIISLTCADLSFCLGVLPFQVLHFLFDLSFKDGFMCSAVPFVRYLTSAAPLMNLMLIAMNRYINIAQRNIYSRVYQDKWIALMIVCSWLISFTFLLPTLFGVWGKFAYDQRLGACSIVNDDYGRSSKLALFITGFLVPLVIIIACYACILYMTYRWNKHARKRGLLTRHKERNQEQRVTIMAVALTVTYLICYLPLTMAKLLDSSIQLPLFQVIGYCFWYAEATLNPVLYVLLNNQYRKEFGRVARSMLYCPYPGRKKQMGITQDFTQQIRLDATPNASQVIEPGGSLIDNDKHPAWI